MADNIENVSSDLGITDPESDLNMGEKDVQGFDANLEAMFDGLTEKVESMLHGVQSKFDHTMDTMQRSAKQAVQWIENLFKNLFVEQAEQDFSDETQEIKPEAKVKSSQANAPPSGDGQDSIDTKSVNDSFSSLNRLSNILDNIAKKSLPKLSTGFKKLEPDFNKLSGISKDLSEQLSKLGLKGLSSDVKDMGTVFEGLSNAESTISDVSETITGVSSTIGELQTTLTALTSGFSPVMLAIAAVIAIGVLLWNHWDDIKKIAGQVWETISGAFSGAVEWFSSLCSTVWSVICGVFSVVGGFFLGIWQGICDIFMVALEWFSGLCSTVWEAICAVFSVVGEFFGGIWDGICEIFSVVATWFGEQFGKAWDGITGAFASVGKFFGEVWDGICRVFGNVAGWFKDKFSAAWKAVKDVFSAGGKVFNGIKDGILDGLKFVINGLIEGINTIISVPFKGINGALKLVRDIDLPIVGKVFGFLPTIPTPKIPKLAHGGYVKANTPRLAMIGDNQHQGEIVAPEDKLYSTTAQAVRDFMGNGSNVTPDVIEAIQATHVLLREIIQVIDNKNLTIGDREIASSARRGERQLGHNFGFNL